MNPETDPYQDAPRLPEEQPLDPRRLFSRPAAPLELEIGPGRGWFILERLEAAPVNLIGLEIRRKWATIVDRRLAERGLAGRARVFAEDARSALPRFVGACLDVVFIHFPDPWWKKRHHKRLVVEPGLVGQLARVLRPGGELFIQTDVEERAEAYEQVVAAEPRFTPVGETARVADGPWGGARSPRERRALTDGLPVVRLHYRRGA